MGFMDRFFPGQAVMEEVRELRGQVRQLEEQRSITELPWNVGQPEDVAGRTPTQQKALRLAPVYGAVSMIARSIASLPLHAYRRSGDKTSRLPYLPQLFTQPSVHGELSDWLHRLLTSLLLTGNAYGLVTARDGFGYPTMIEWLDPQQVQIIDQNLWGRGSYWDPIYYWRGRNIDPEQLIHIPWFSIPFRVKGLSPLSAFAAAVEVGLSGQKYTSDWYKSGGVPPGTFKNSQKTVTEPEANTIKGRLVNAIRTHEPIVYGNDWDYNPIAISPHEADFVQSHQLSATDIAVVYGIYPAERIGGVTKTSMTYTNVEAEQIQWTNITLLPYVSKLESYFFNLLPLPQYVKFQIDAQIRADSLARHQIHQIDREIGLKNIDEIRQVEDMPPLPNGQGQDYNPLVAVRELIRAQAISSFDPNLPGFQAGPPPAPGSGGLLGAQAQGQAQGATPPQAGAQGAAPNGRFTAQPGELRPVARSEEEDGAGPPPF